MKVTRYLFLALLLSMAFATSALALPVNKVLTVQLATVSAVGQVAPFRSISVTTDASGKAAFSFANVPTSDIAPFLMVRIIDGTAVLRQSIVVAPAPNGAVNVGVSEVTTSQATAMLKAFADSGSGNATLAAMVMTMVRSGAITDPDLRNASPLARDAATAFESFLTSHGAGGQLAAFRANLLPALRDFAAKYKESVDTVALANDANTANPIQDLLDKTASNQREATKRGDAIALFLGALVNAGADAGISPALMHLAVTEAGKAAEAAVTVVSSDVVTAMIAAFRTGAEHCQLRAEIRSYAGALPFLNMSSATALAFNNMTTVAKQQQFNTAVQKFNAAAATLGDAMVTAQETFELLFADPVAFPSLQDIAFGQDSLSLTLQSLTANFIADTTASPGDIITMQMNVASGTGMTLSTLQGMGIGSMFTSPSASSQNWTMIMVAGANFVTPPIQMTYSTSVNSELAAKLLAANVTVPPPPQFSLFSNPYKSLLRLQYDLMLLKFNSQLPLAQPTTQLALATVKEYDLAKRSSMLQNITISGVANGTGLANALMVTMAQPELL